MECVGCGAVKLAKFLGEVLPPFGWRGEAVPICDMCDNTEQRYVSVVEHGKREVWEVDVAPHPVAAGDLVYIDTFSELVPAKLLEFRVDPFRDEWCAMLRVTGDRGGYAAVGEHVAVPLDRVVRRESVRVRGGKYVITNNWHVVAGGERVDVFAGDVHAA